jgi:hypothetical protein
MNSIRYSTFCLLSCVFVLGCSKSSQPPSSADTTETECGVERWHVKTLLDPDTSSISWTPVTSSIAEQNAFAEVTVSEFEARQDFEKVVVSIPCIISAYKKEADGDIHLVLLDAENDSMIGEIPSVDCHEVAGSPYASEFQSAFQWVTDNLGKASTSFNYPNASVTITGVQFQDYPHGQVGHAKNYREIHPVTKIE